MNFDLKIIEITEGMSPKHNPEYFKRARHSRFRALDIKLRISPSVARMTISLSGELPHYICYFYGSLNSEIPDTYLIPGMP